MQTPLSDSLTHNTAILVSVSLPERLHVSLFKFCREFRRWAEVNGRQTTVLLEESAVLLVFNSEVDEKGLILLGQQPCKEGTWVPDSVLGGMGGQQLLAAVGRDNVG